MVVVNYYAAIAAELECETENLTSDSIAEVLEHLLQRQPESTTLPIVLARCSFLVNGVVSSDKSSPLNHADQLDILPPFSGG